MSISHDDFMQAQFRIADLEGQLAEARGLPTDGEICHSCGSAVSVIWHARDEEWEAVVGGPGGIRCVRCFAAEAEQKGIHVAFVAVPFEGNWKTDLHEAQGERDEAKAILSGLPDHSDLDAAVFEANALRGQLAEAQGKLDAVQRAVDAASDSGRYTLALVEIAAILSLDRILSKKEGTNDV